LTLNNFFLLKNHASQDANMKMFEKPSEKDAIAVFLRRSIQVAAENVPVFFTNLRKNFKKIFRN